MPFVHGLGNLACPCMVYIAVGKDSPRLQRMGMKSQHDFRQCLRSSGERAPDQFYTKIKREIVPENGKQLVAGLQEHL